MKYILISVPKSGTNMITQAIGGSHHQIDGRIQEHDRHPHPYVIKELVNFDRFARSHLPFSSFYPTLFKIMDIKGIFLYRDPRDSIVSWLYWIQREGEIGGGFINFMTDEGVRVAESSDPIKWLISKSAYHWERFIGWMNVEGVLSLSYEDILENKERELQKIAEFTENSFGSVNAMQTRINPSSCSTFRKGIIGDWKNHFTDEHTEYFNKEMKRIMEVMGYE